VQKKTMRASLQEMLRHEIALLRKVDHPNVIQLFETYEDQDNIYLVLELASGGELFDSLVDAELGHYTEAHAAHVFYMMILGVRHCHQQGIIHRDLKLENFIFETKAHESQLKLIDFGLSKKFNEREEQRRVGTCYYMAPEVLDRQEYTFGCDVWGLGVLLYMMLTGVPPFEGEDDKEIRAAVHIGKYDWSVEEEFGFKISDEAKDLVAKMLVMDHAKRIDLRDALTHPWVQKRLAEDKVNHDHALDKSVATRLKNFGHFRKIKRVALELVALQLTPDVIHDLREQFIKLDADGSGSITLAEFQEGMKGHYADEHELKELFENLDEGHDGRLSYHEFLAAAIDHNAVFTKGNIETAFKRFNIEDKNGIVHKELLEKSLRTLYSDEQMQVS